VAVIGLIAVIIVGIGVLLALVLFALSLPDLARYMRVRKM
jgi:hypothetical protein